MPAKRRTSLNPLGLVCVLSLLSLVLGLSAYVVSMGWTGTINPDTCEYDGTGYYIGFGAYGIATVLVGATSVLTPWKPRAMKAAFISMVVGFGVATIATSVPAFTTIAVSGFEGKLSPGWTGDPIVNNEENWGQIKRCFERNNVSRAMFADPSAEPATNVELDCCRPPRHCAFQYRNGTYWSVAEKDDPECKEWEGKKEEVCYDCSSCKLGYLFTVMDPWSVLNCYCIASVMFLGFSVAVAEEDLFKQNNDEVEDGGTSADNKVTDVDDEDEEMGKLLGNH